MAAATPTTVHIDADGLVSRVEGETPFARIIRKAEHRLWSVAYRDGDGFTTGNCSFPTRKGAVAECEWAARTLSAHQLGLDES